MAETYKAENDEKQRQHYAYRRDLWVPFLSFLPHLSRMRTCSGLLPDLVWTCKKKC